MDVQELILFPKAIIYVIEGMPTVEKMVVISAFVGLGALIYVLTVSSVVFNYFIIPSIERRLGKRLQYDPLYEYIFLSRWLIPQTEVSFYIIRRYCALIFKGEHGLPEKRNRFALKKAGFTIDCATKFEIAMSFLWLINVLLFCVSGAVVLVLNGHHNFFS